MRMTPLNKNSKIFPHFWVFFHSIPLDDFFEVLHTTVIYLSLCGIIRNVAMNALSGRKFATRVVLTSFYDPEMYHNRVFK